RDARARRAGERHGPAHAPVRDPPGRGCRRRQSRRGGDRSCPFRLKRRASPSDSTRRFGDTKKGPGTGRRPSELRKVESWGGAAAVLLSRGLARGGLAGRGLARRRLTGRGLARRGLACRGLLGAGALCSRPLGGCPLRSCPLRSCPLRSCPLRSCPLRSCPLRSCPLRSCPLGGAAFCGCAFRSRALGTADCGGRALGCATQAPFEPRDCLLEARKSLFQLADGQRLHEVLHRLHEIATSGGCATASCRPYAPHGAFDALLDAASPTSGPGHILWASLLFVTGGVQNLLSFTHSMVAVMAIVNDCASRCCQGRQLHIVSECSSGGGPDRLTS